MAEEKKMNGFRARVDYVLKHNQTINKILRYIVSAFMRIWGWFIPMDSISKGTSCRYRLCI